MVLRASNCLLIYDQKYLSGWYHVFNCIGQYHCILKIMQKIFTLCSAYCMLVKCICLVCIVTENLLPCSPFLRFAEQKRANNVTAISNMPFQITNCLKLNGTDYCLATISIFVGLYLNIEKIELKSVN